MKSAQIEEYQNIGRGQKNNELLLIRLNKDQKEKLKQLSKQQGFDSVSNYARHKLFEDLTKKRVLKEEVKNATIPNSTD
jgi:hypothetical protein